MCRLYRRAEDVFSQDDGLHTLYRQRQNRLKAQQRLYAMRLKQLVIAARQVRLASPDGGADREMIKAEQRHAIAQLRALDRHHLHRTEAIQAGY